MFIAAFHVLGVERLCSGLWDVSRVRTCVDNSPVSGEIWALGVTRMFLSRVFDMVTLALMCKASRQLRAM